MVKIKNLPDRKMISPARMNVGSVGIIRKWGEGCKSYIGSVVMKSDSCHLVHLDPVRQAKTGGWDTADKLDTDEHLIELFPSGVVLEITIE